MNFYKYKSPFLEENVSTPFFDLKRYFPFFYRKIDSLPKVRVEYRRRTLDKSGGKNWKFRISGKLLRWPENTGQPIISEEIYLSSETHDTGLFVDCEIMKSNPSLPQSLFFYLLILLYSSIIAHFILFVNFYWLTHFPRKNHLRRSQDAECTIGLIFFTA